ncbi:MAG: hypothetical protein GY906_03190 [bacterium]|nr:hypothetical protein [bacterium]
MMQPPPKHRTCRSIIAAAMCLLLPLCGCSWIRQQASRYPAADVDAIYRTSHPNTKRNPVILIHGFAGAKIVRSSDNATVWGAFFTEDAPLPSKPEGLRALALDIDTLPDPVNHQDLLRIEDDSRATELLEHARAGALVTTLDYDVYAGIVEMTERAGYAPCRSIYEPATVTNEPACFTFFYDWRQDTVGNAIALGSFVEEARRQVEQARTQRRIESPDPVKFDIVAHSLGGLVTRYFLRYGARDVLAEPIPQITWAGSDAISRAILIAPPNFGAMEALVDLVEGIDYPVFNYEAALLATYTSFYQLLPREHHPLWLDDVGNLIPFEFMSASVWRDNEWGPFAKDQKRHLEVLFPSLTSDLERADRMAGYMDAAFERARRFSLSLDRHPDTPSPTPLILFAADAEPTLAKALVTSTKDGKIRLKFKKDTRKSEPGDGRVTRVSALADERAVDGSFGWLSSPIPWSQTFFLTDAHQSILRSPTFQNNLLHLLLDTPPEP